MGGIGKWGRKKGYGGSTIIEDFESPKRKKTTKGINKSSKKPRRTSKEKNDGEEELPGRVTGKTLRERNNTKVRINEARNEVQSSKGKNKGKLTGLGNAYALAKSYASIASSGKAKPSNSKRQARLRKDDNNKLSMASTKHQAYYDVMITNPPSETPDKAFSHQVKRFLEVVREVDPE